LSQVPTDRPILKWAVISMACLFGLTALSQIKLQTWEQVRTLKLASDSKRFEFTSHDIARRGSILGSDDKPLAQDEKSFALTVKFKKVPHSDAFFLELAQATGIPASEFSTLAAQDGQKTKSWLEPMPSDRYKAIMDLRKRWRADGISLAPTGQRTYPLGDAASCFVGVIKNYKEGTVHTGFERSMDASLTGKDGLRIGLTDRNGAFLPMRMDRASVLKRDGEDVVLTIDTDLQALASESIKSTVEENKADYGVALAMDPKTGEILAMANWPSFDPNASTASQGQFGFNPAYMAQLEPGSMFKILTLAKGLDEGAVNLNDSIYCSGEWHPTPTSIIHCDKHHGTRAHGQVSTLDAIARSCNVSAAIWATHVGRDNFIKFIRDLKVTYPTQLGLPGERRGNVDYADYAQKLQLACWGFGQSITCTPVGLLGGFGMIGNDGIRVEPRILRRVGSKIYKTEPGTQVVKPETAHTVMKCMEAVIQSDEGTGAKLRIPGYRLAGKTGTAERVGKGEHGYVSNFVGFVPAQNPKALILVMVSNPKGIKYYGADVAGPVFSQLAKAVIRHYNIPPTESISTKIAAKPSKSTQEPSTKPFDKEAATP